VRFRGGVEDTTFEAKDSETARGQGQGLICQGQFASGPRPERLEANIKDSRIHLKIRANINVNIVIMISQAFKHKLYKHGFEFEFAYKSGLAKSIATILCLLHPTYHRCLLFSLLVCYLLQYTVLNEYICG